MPALLYKPGDIIKHAEMNLAEKSSLQRGMNFRPKGRCSVFLMSVRRGAPYNDHVEEDGRVLVYEGHDVNRVRGGPDPKSVDQPESLPSGRPTQNGLFAAAARDFKTGHGLAEPVRVYEKMRQGIWVYNGQFRLVDAWREKSGRRMVFKFRLELPQDQTPVVRPTGVEAENTRVIPADVKQEVWRRDKGRCRECGSDKNLHFDHIIPWSKGGSSLTADNIQLLCAKHNLVKHDRIE